jgi:hypothetical protein
MGNGAMPIGPKQPRPSSTLHIRPGSYHSGLMLAARPPATECRGSHGRFMDAFCLDLSVCERHHSIFHEDKWWVVYCFADPEHAEKFRIRFGGRTIQSNGPRPWFELGAVVQERTLSAYIADMRGRFTRNYT